MRQYQDFVLNSLGSIKNFGSIHTTFVMREIKLSYKISID
ncbi:hypothetical protein [Confluentibacter sediminis]|nr:hypothetical protein [Confluentibacter sediminis]